MACVSVTFRAEAERLLSRRRADWAKSLRQPELFECALHPDFVNNDAGYLHSLRFSWRCCDDVKVLTIGELCDGLLLMTSLKHLTIDLPETCPAVALNAINAALPRCTFSLKTLNIFEHVNLLPWILNQIEIETIAVRALRPWGYDSDKHLNCYRLLSSSLHHRKPPTFFIFSEADDEATVAAFPTFSAGWSAKTIKQYLDGFLSPRVVIDVFALHLRSLDELENSHLAIESISYHFRRVKMLILRVEDYTIHLNPNVLASAILYLGGQLQVLHVEFWKWPLKEEQMVHSYKDKKLELAKAWSEGCPSLDFIIFPDNDERVRDAGWKSWMESLGLNRLL